MKRLISSLLFAIVFYTGSFSQVSQVSQVEFTKEKQSPVVHVTIGGKPFTDFFFPDTIAKPVLYPIKAPNGINVTRGYPVRPVPGDPTDHPHHLGLWMNYENVNGLDFWNNSFAIPADKKGAIETALNKLKEAHKNQDIPAVDAAMAEMNTAWTAASEDIYKAQQESGAQPGADAGTANADAAKSDTVEDAQFEEVK